MRRIGGARRTGLAVLVAALAAVALSACGVSDGDRPFGSATSHTQTTGAGADGVVVAAGEASVALVDTPFATGSAVLVGDGYAVTNAHVVDPFDEVNVTFADGEDHLGVPVVGVDLVADLALLGPIDTDRPALTAGDPDALSSGDAIHLVGFPGDQDVDAPELEVEDGRYARHQYPKNWDLDYLQANVDIPEGQSGGAMVDARGRLVGISALELDDGVALSLAVDDVERIAAELEEGSPDGPAGDWTPVPRQQGRRIHDVRFDGPDDVRAFYVSGAALAGELTVEVSDPEARVAVMEPGFFPVAANGPAVAAGDRAEGVWSFLADADDLETVEPDEDGAFTLDMEEGEERIVLVGSDSTDPVRVTTAPGSVELDLVPGARPLRPGAPVLDALGYLDAIDVFEVDLVAGQEIALDAESASGDVAFVFARPGEPWGTAEAYDETGSPHSGPGGMLGLDEHASITADETGRYTVVVYAADDSPTAYRLTLTAD